MIRLLFALAALFLPALALAQEPPPSSTLSAQIDAFTAYVLTVPNLSIVASVWVVMWAARRFLPTATEHSFYARAEPLLPIALASAAVWIPGAVEGGSLAARIFLGIMLGFCAAHARKLLRQTVLGRDSRIAGVLEEPEPPAPPTAS